MECQKRFLTARFWNWLVSQSHTTQQIPSRRVGILNYLPISHYRRWWNQPVQYDKIIMSFALQKCRICLGSLTVEPEWNKWCARNIWNFCNRWKHLITSTKQAIIRLLQSRSICHILNRANWHIWCWKYWPLHSQGECVRCRFCLNGRLCPLSDEIIGFLSPLKLYFSLTLTKHFLLSRDLVWKGEGTGCDRERQRARES